MNSKRSGSMSNSSGGVAAAAHLFCKVIKSNQGYKYQGEYLYYFKCPKLIEQR